MSRPDPAATLDERRPRGLPGPLPAGERLLWQGTPRFAALLRRPFHLRAVAVYFALLMLWSGFSRLHDGATAAVAAKAALWLALLGLAALALLALLAWLIARSTVYSITNRRVLLHFGVALEMTLNLPLSDIEAVAVGKRADGSGDLLLTLPRTPRLGYLVLWPHVRPWHFTLTQPLLRGLADAAEAGAILAEAVAATLDVARPIRAVPQRHRAAA